MPGEHPPARPRPRAVAWALASAGAVAVQAVAVWIWPSFDPGLAGGFVLSFSLVVGCVMVCAVLAPTPGPEWLAASLVPAAAVVAVGVVGPPPDAVAPLLLVTLCLLLAGTLIGAVIGARIEHPGHLLVVAYITALVDLYSALAPEGLTAQVLESERLLPLLALSWPVPGTPEVSPVLGVGDVVMTALYLACSRRHGLGRARTLVALLLAYAATATALLVLLRPVPALPLLGVAVVLAHPQARSLARKDRKVALTGMGLATAFVLVRWLV